MRRIAAAVVTFTVLASLPALAQERQRAMPAWDPNTVETVKGTVARSREMGRAELVVIAVKTDKESVLVALAPRGMLDASLAELKQDTAVEVTGSRVKGQQQREFLLASKVKVGDKEYKLRNDKGELLGKDGQPLRQRQRQR
jgi:hypothetical protein